MRRPSGREAVCAVRYVLGSLMSDAPAKLPLHSTVALLDDMAEQGLRRGQVGTVVDDLDEEMALVEFSDDEGRAYSVAPCPWVVLLPLRAASLTHRKIGD